MIGSFLAKLTESGVKEIASKGSETMVKDFPKNLQNLKPEDFRDYKDVDKPVTNIDSMNIKKNPTAREVAGNPELQQDLFESIKENSPYSDEVNEQIATREELDYYLKNEYTEVDINGKKVLVPKDLDLEQKDEDGKSNGDRMKEGKPPLDKNEEPYNLHHIGQNPDGPFSLIPNCDHKSMSGQLHDTTKTSEIDRVAFQGEKKEIFRGIAKIFIGEE